MLKDWMRKNELEDIWRMQHKDRRQYTRKVEKEGKRAKRIDYIMIDKKHTGMVTETKILETEDRKWLSDHKILKAKMLGMPIIRASVKENMAETNIRHKRPRREETSNESSNAGMGKNRNKGKSSIRNVK